MSRGFNSISPARQRIIDAVCVLWDAGKSASVVALTVNRDHVSERPLTRNAVVGIIHRRKDIVDIDGGDGGTPPVRPRRRVLVPAGGPMQGRLRGRNAPPSVAPVVKQTRMTRESLRPKAPVMAVSAPPLVLDIRVYKPGEVDTQGRARNVSFDAFCERAGCRYLDNGLFCNALRGATEAGRLSSYCPAHETLVRKHVV